MINANQRKSVRPAAWPAIGLFVLIGGIFAGVALDYLNWAKIDDQYHHAPGCAVGPVSVDTALPACTVKPYTIVAKRQFVSGGRSSTTHYILDISAADGDSRPIDLEDQNLWNELSAGDSINVQLWQGKSRLVYALGQSAPTSNNPDYRKRNTSFLLVFMGVTDAVIAVLFLYLFFSKSRRKALATSTTAWYAAQSPSAAPVAPPPSIFGSQQVASYPAVSSTLSSLGNQDGETITGDWQGMYYYNSGMLPDTAFDAHFEVAESGTVSGMISDHMNRGQATVAGEQEGRRFRFVKQYVTRRAKPVEYDGEIAPDGRTISGTWSLTSSLLGIPLTTHGHWSAMRVADENPRARTEFQSGEL